MAQSVSNSNLNSMNNRTIRFLRWAPIKNLLLLLFLSSFFHSSWCCLVVSDVVCWLLRGSFVSVRPRVFSFYIGIDPLNFLSFTIFLFMKRCHEFWISVIRVRVFFFKLMDAAGKSTTVDTKKASAMASHPLLSAIIIKIPKFYILAHLLSLRIVL